MTPRTWARLGLILLMAVVVQVAILNGIVIAGAHADLFLALAIAAGLAGGPQRGAVMAFVTGLVADLFVPTPYGLSALCYVLVAFGVGLAAVLPAGRAPLSFQLATALVAGVGGTLLYAGLGTLIGQPSIPRHELVSVVTVVTLGCVLFISPVYRMLEGTLAAAPGAHHDAATYVGGSAR
jgi:rod shape-determining protein MreD